VVTFTLYDQHMAVDLGVPLEKVARALQGIADDSEAEVDSRDQDGTQTPYALKPAAVSLLERSGRPFHIADVSAQAGDGGLTVTAWVRAKRLRLAPVRFAWKQVDNSAAANAFAQEVRVRSRAASHPGRFRGPMDYWVSWLLLGVLLFTLFLPRGDAKNQDSDQA
jgi:hypothetical protein